eukprot:4905319-Pleurochrysis_carterae.AAC.1
MFVARSNRAFYYGQEEVDCGLVVDQERRKLAATPPGRVERQLHTRRDRTCDAVGPTETVT